MIDQLLHLVGGQPSHNYFPLFPWLIYPLTGLAIGALIQQPYPYTGSILLSSSFIFGAQWILQFTPFHYPWSEFYRTWPDASIMHLSFVLIWLMLWKIAAPRLAIYSRICRLLTFCSRHITIIYLIQWPLIFWLLPLIGFRQLSLCATIIISTIVTLIVVLLTKLLSKRWPQRH
jgi:hypothetical protein